MSFKKAIIVTSIIALVVVATLVTGCTTVKSQGVPTADSTENCQVRDYGNGVLFFSCNDAAFGQKLSQYLDTHPVTVTAVAEVDQQFVEFQNTLGFFVIVK